MNWKKAIICLILGLGNVVTYSIPIEGEDSIGLSVELQQTATKNTCQTDPLKPVSLYSGKLNISIPSELAIMPPEIVKIKYANARQQPDIVYANEKGSVSIAFNLTDTEVEAADLPDVKDALEGQIKTKALSDFESSLTTINGHQYVVFEFISQAIDTTIYNRIFLTDLNGQMLIGTINCTEPLLATYKPVIDSVFESMKKQ